MALYELREVHAVSRRPNRSRICPLQASTTLSSNQGKDAGSENGST